MVEVVTVPYGRQAAEALRAQVKAAKHGRPLAPVTVVVPSNHAGVAMRRHLAARQGLVAVTFLTLHRLAELLGAPRLAGSGRRPLSAPVVAAAVRATLAAEPGTFADVAAHPATEQALVAAHRELADLSVEGLRTLTSQSRRAAEVVRVHLAVRRRLAPAWYDEHDLLGAAVASLAEGVPLARSLGTVIVHLPQHLSAAGGRLLAEVARHAPLTVVAGITGDERADAAVVRSMGRLGVAPDRAAARAIVPATGSKVVTASDADDEVRVVVRAVVDAAREGIPLERMAVLYASPDPYARLVHAHLAAAGIVHNGSPVVRIADGLLARGLRSLLALPGRGFRRADVAALLAHVPVRGGAGHLVPASAWERVSRAAGVVAGRDDWQRRLTRFAADQRAEAAGCEARLVGGGGDHAEGGVAPAERQGGQGGEGAEGLARRLRRQADHAERLRGFVARLFSDLDEASVPPTWKGKVGWAHALVRCYLGGEQLRARWPEHEVRSAEKVEAALDRLAGLDSVEPASPVAGPDLDVFRRTLEAELEAGLDRIGRFGEGVLVGHVGLAVGLDLDRVFVLGLAEGVFPASRLDDSLLPDRERAACGGELARRADRADDEHRQLLAALAAAAGERMLSFPRGDLRRSGGRVASRWLLDTVAALEGRRVASSELSALADRPWFTEARSFSDGLGRLRFPATPQEHALCALGFHHRMGGRIEHHPLAVADPVLRLGVDSTTARRSRAFTRFDGNLAHLVGPGSMAGRLHLGRDGVVSATRLQDWASCPHRYFMAHVLRVEPVEVPEQRLDLGPLDHGSIVHESLDRFLREVLARPGGPPAPGERWAPGDRARLRALAEEVCADYDARGLTGKPVFWRRTRARLLRDLDLLLDADDERRALWGTRPVASELAFGLPRAGGEPIEVELSDGQRVRLRGSADRVDVTTSGSLVVIDYKTGSDRPYADLSEADPDCRGTKLQLPVYALAARAAHGDARTPVHAAYWFVTRKRRFAWIGYDLTEGVAARFDRVLRTIVDGIARGVFVPHPEEPASFRLRPGCVYCDPDGLGTSDGRREWERKRDDPLLEAYRDLAEPPEQPEELEQPEESARV